MKKNIFILFLVMVSFVTYANDFPELLSVLDKYTKTNSIEISGNSTSYIATSNKPVMDSDFKIVKQNGLTCYEDKYHTLLLLLNYDIWLDHVQKQIYISYKSSKKQKESKYINPYTALSHLQTQIKDCTKKKLVEGEEFTITYNNTSSDCIKSNIKINDNKSIKSIQYYFTEESYLSKTIIEYKSIDTDLPENNPTFNESNYVIKTGDKWMPNKSYKNYKIQIFEYEELF